jgi:hypothetical protein
MSEQSPSGELTPKQKAQAAGGRAIDALIAIMDDENQPSTLRMAAAEKVLDRGFGKATVMVEAEIKQVTYLDFIDKVIEKEGRFQQILSAVEIVDITPAELPDWSKLLQ